MPELPEVEALRLGLIKKILRQKIIKVEVRQEKIIAGKGTLRKADKKKTEFFKKILLSKEITDIKRRAKNLLIKLATGEIILVHLKMTGQLVYQDDKTSTSFSGGHPIEESTQALPHKHTHLIFKLEKGTLFYNDVRQFGYLLYYPTVEVLETEKHFANIGMDPFDKKFTLEYFAQIKKYKTPIKKLLLDQKVVVGCGNIYCDEVLWASSVLPTRPANTLTKNEIERIYTNIKLILEKAISSGGSSIANYLLVDGTRGNYADYHNAYQKHGVSCKFPRCKGVIIKKTLFGRGTHYCPVHQK